MIKIYYLLSVIFLLFSSGQTYLSSHLTIGLITFQLKIDKTEIHPCCQIIIADKRNIIFNSSVYTREDHSQNSN